MKKSKLNENQMVTMLNEGEAGIPVAELCRKYQISNATFYKLKTKYAGMSAADLKRMKTLEEGNRRLKQMYANLSLEHSILKDVVPSPHRRKLIDEVVTHYQVSKQVACKIARVSRSVYYYKSIKKAEAEVIIGLLKQLAQAHPRWGFRKMLAKLKHQGHGWNHKRVHRIYVELNLNIRIKPKKRIPSREAVFLFQPIEPNVCWSMDFMNDVLRCGAKIRTLNVIDDYNREALLIAANHSSLAQRVTHYLDEIVSGYDSNGQWPQVFIKAF